MDVLLSWCQFYMHNGTFFHTITKKKVMSTSRETGKNGGHILRQVS